MMRKTVLPALAGALFLGLGGFVAQQTVGYDQSTGSICVYDKATPPVCAPLAIIDSASHAVRFALGSMLGTDTTTTPVASGSHVTVYSANGNLGAIYGQQVNDFTGGSAGDPSAPVSGAIRGYSQTGATVGRYVPLGGLFVSDNASWLAQGVGAGLQGNSYNGARTWGATLEGIERPTAWCTGTASASFCTPTTAGATVLTVSNGYVQGTSAVIQGGTELTRGVGYTETSCSGSSPTLCTGITLASGMGSNQVVYLYRGDPLQAFQGVEVDATGGPGPDTQNSYTGNRIAIGIVAGKDTTTAFSGTTHVGSGIAMTTNSGVVMDRGISFSGTGGTFNGGIGLTFDNTSFETAAIYSPGLLSQHQQIGIGDKNNAFGLEMAGTSTTMPNGVGIQLRDTTSTTIDTRVISSPSDGAAEIGAFSAHPLWLRAAGAVPMVVGDNGGTTNTNFATVYAKAGMKLSPITVSNLPACGAGTEGTIYVVTDAKSATFNAMLAGGGSNHVMAYCNGTNWTVH